MWMGDSESENSEREETVGVVGVEVGFGVSRSDGSSAGVAHRSFTVVCTGAVDLELGE